MNTIFTEGLNIGSITHMVKYHVSAIESVTEYANHIRNTKMDHIHLEKFTGVVFGFNYNLKDSCDKIKQM